jgi:hypothetical protein
VGFKGSKIGVEQEGYRLPQNMVCIMFFFKSVLLYYDGGYCACSTSVYDSVFLASSEVNGNTVKYGIFRFGMK